MFQGINYHYLLSIGENICTLSASISSLVFVFSGLLGKFEFE